MIEIGRVFATSWAMLRQRFWLLVGMWAVFFAIQMAGSLVLGIGLAVMGAAAGGASLSAFDDPGAMTGLGVGVVIFMVLFYGAYIVLVLAQQAAMVTLASPLEEAAFGAAMSRGFKSALPFFGITIVLIFGYVLIGGLFVGAAGLAGVGAGAAGAAVTGILVLLALPVLIYLGCRLSVLIPVVAVDQVFNPIAAIRRSWGVTRGRVVGILLSMLAFIVISLVILGLPFALIFGAAFTGPDNPGAAAGAAIFGFLLFIPLIIVYTLFATAYIAALHSEVTGGGSEALEEVFA